MNKQQVPTQLEFDFQDSVHPSVSDQLISLNLGVINNPNMTHTTGFLTTTGVKYDSSKIRLSLYPAEAMYKIAEVLEFGAKKYAVDNWKYVQPIERYFDAALRHLMAIKTGELNDPESGLSHLAHAGTCIAFMLYHESKGLNLKL